MIRLPRPCLDAFDGLGFLLNQLRHVLGQCLAYRLRFFLLRLLKEELLRFLLHGLGLDPLGLDMLLGFHWRRGGGGAGSFLGALRRRRSLLPRLGSCRFRRDGGGRERGGGVGFQQK
jgi:hypothetical protein